MKFNMKFRLAALGLAVGLMAALILYITLNSQREVVDLQNRLSNLDLESSGPANQFRNSIRELNNAVIGYGINRDPAAWADCLKKSDQLKAWIIEQKFKLRNPSEKEILQQMDRAFGNYRDTIQDFHNKIAAMGARDSASLSDIAPVRAKAQELGDLSRALMQAHYQSHDDL